MNQPAISLPADPAEHRVVILGASPKADRYSNRAQHLLMEAGYQVIPVHPKIEEIEGVPVVHDLRDVEKPVHTLTFYVGPQRTVPMIEAIAALAPKRVIFNPGTESGLLEERLARQGAECIRGCTLVMLRTHQF
ncbi:CoA-binding protein [Thiohalomonas denitrificans]|uniref:CoA-binding protein n=1 Tax=Thiohalomonas denitrificans TaxID=415747 RepID=UPI0026F24087|nr:CoA-binding protein [Thiohalomonas denitrificans]